MWSLQLRSATPDLHDLSCARRGVHGEPSHHGPQPIGLAIVYPLVQDEEAGTPERRDGSAHIRSGNGRVGALLGAVFLQAARVEPSADLLAVEFAVLMNG